MKKRPVANPCVETRPADANRSNPGQLNGVFRVLRGWFHSRKRRSPVLSASAVMPIRSVADARFAYGRLRAVPGEFCG